MVNATNDSSYFLYITYSCLQLTYTLLSFKLVKNVPECFVVSPIGDTQHGNEQLYTRIAYGQGSKVNGQQ